MAQHFCQLAHLAHRFVKSDLKLLHHGMTFLVLRLLLLICRCCALTLLWRLLHRSQLLTGIVNVRNGTGDLTDLLVVGILTLNLVLKVLLQRLVL